jgi:hypothetical protein
MALIGALSGCSARPVVWSKPGASEAALQRDLQQCALQAKAASPTYFDSRTMSTVSSPQEAQRLKNSCMIGHGWRLVPQP